MKSAKNFCRSSEGAAEGGCGGNSAAPELSAKPRRLPELLRAETSKNIFFSLIEKNWGWRAKSKNVKKMFLLGTRALRAAAGRSDWFRSGISDKMSSSQTVKTHKRIEPLAHNTILFKTISIYNTQCEDNKKQKYNKTKHIWN